jgi:hypothetical protein
MGDEMDDQELARLLRLVDEPVEEVPAVYERVLWDELAATFDAPPVQGAGSRHEGATDSGDMAFVPVDDRRVDRARWLRWGSLAAALVAAVAVGVVLANGSGADPSVEDSSSSAGPVTTGPPVTTGSSTAAVVEPTDPGASSEPTVLVDPVEACARFRGGVARLPGLPDALEDLRGSGAPASLDGVRTSIEGVRTALENYAADLAAGGLIDRGQVLEFRNVAGMLGQAIAELDGGDVDAAARTVDQVRSSVNSLLGELEVPGLRYDPFGELLVECGS